MTDYKSIYERDDTSGNYLIEVNLDKYMDFYHEWDSSRFKKRDIHPELAEYLTECSTEIPLKEPVEISLYVRKILKDDHQESLIRSSYEHYYTVALDASRRSLLHLLRNVVLSVFVAVILLVFAEKSPEFLREGLLQTLITEGFYVGGWVFMWEAVYALAFELPEKGRAKRTIKRLLSSPLSFRYVES